MELNDALVQDAEKSVVVYQSNDGEIQIEVKIADETVWLNRHQMAVLFSRDVKTIGKHIKNALVEELKGLSVVANFATTASNGKTYQVEYYNLDMVLSVGYRVKSQSGIKFRQWANSVLKEYIYRRYAVSQRFERLENRVFRLEEKSDEFDIIIKGSLPPHEGIFYDGQVFDAYVCVKRQLRV